MVNICERVINVVNANQPTLLTGWSQTALEWVVELADFHAWAANTPGGEHGPTASAFHRRNMVSPLHSPGVGTLQSGPMVRRVKDGGGSEGRAVMVRIGVAALAPTSPHAKACRLPSGRSVREPWANQLYEAEQMTAACPLVRLLAERRVGSQSVTHRPCAVTAGSPVVTEGL